MEFIDDLYKRILIDEGGKLTTAHQQAILTKKENNVENKLQYIDFKQIENSYQLFRKRHPEYPEYSFRRHCWVRLTFNQSNDTEAKKFFDIVHWPYPTQEQLRP